jgi:hypothetical protein
LTWGYLKKKRKKISFVNYFFIHYYTIKTFYFTYN